MHHTNILPVSETCTYNFSVSITNSYMCIFLSHKNTQSFKNIHIILYRICTQFFSHMFLAQSWMQMISLFPIRSLYLSHLPHTLFLYTVFLTHTGINILHTCIHTHTLSLSLPPLSLIHTQTYSTLPLIYTNLIYLHIIYLSISRTYSGIYFIHISSVILLIFKTGKLMNMHRLFEIGFEMIKLKYSKIVDLSNFNHNKIVVA